MSRDLREAATQLATATDEWLELVAHHDPDMIRYVARTLALSVGCGLDAHSESCAIQDSYNGPCSCGADETYRKRIEGAKA